LRVNALVDTLPRLNSGLAPLTQKGDSNPAPSAHKH